MVEIKSETNFDFNSIIKLNENQKKKNIKVFEKKTSEVPEEVILELQELLFFMPEIRQAKKNY